MNVPIPEQSCFIDLKKYYSLFLSTSKRVWGYFDYVGFITPWHDFDNAYIYMHRSKKKFVDFIERCEESDMDLETTLFFICALSNYHKWTKPAYLFLDRNIFARLKKFRNYVKTNENYKFFGEFLQHFLTFQVELYGSAFLNGSKIAEKTEEGFILTSFHRMADRIERLKSQNIIPMEWLRLKAEKAHKAFPDQKLFFNTIVNENGFDPSISEVKDIITDEWFTIRRFLGVHDLCTFPDNFIPKGWVPGIQDPKQIKKIVKITGNGFAYYDDGSQLRGCWHYQKNKYLTIKCDPSNFKFFQQNWNAELLRKGSPFWDEYINWGLYPGLWDEDGEPRIPTMKAVRWRGNVKRRTSCRS